MTREQAKIAGAWAAGEVVQYREQFGAPGKWRDFVQTDLQSLNTVEWRIKPKAREWWLCPMCDYKGPTDVADHPTFTGDCEGTLVHVREVLE